MGGNEGRQEWSLDAIKCLLEIFIEEKNRVGKKGSSMRKESWAKLSNALKERFNMVVTQKQMKNAFDNLRAKYVGWVYLRNKTGNIYNAETNTFKLTDEEWEAFKKGHSKAASLRTQPLPYPDLCAALFDGDSATGYLQWTSTATSSRVESSSCNRVLTLELEDNPFDDLEDDDGTNHEADDGVPFNDNATGVCSSPNIEKIRPRKKAKSSVTLDDLAIDMQQALRHMVKSKQGPTTEECYENLILCGLNPRDKLFLAAFNIFGQSMGMREAWMTLPSDPEVLTEWIQLTGMTLGIFK